MELDAAGLPNRVSSPATFNRAFIKSEWKQPVVILIDEMSQMSQAPDEVLDSFLGALRGVRHKEESAIQSVITAGTFGVIRLSSKNPSISPFNVAGTLQMPYFNLEETRYLFNSFQQDYSISIESDVIKDIWAKSNGYARFNDQFNTCVSHLSTTICARVCHQTRELIEVLIYMSSRSTRKEIHATYIRTSYELCYHDSTSSTLIPNSITFRGAFASSSRFMSLISHIRSSCRAAG